MAPTNFQVRATIELRDRSLPVLYSAFRQYVAQGTAILRPLVLVAHHDADAYWRSSEFFLGDHLLIIPITREGSEGRFLYLPEGD
jgi:alpha-glucosidase